MPTPISEQVLKQTIDVFQRNSGNIRATARELGIDRKTVRRRLAKTPLLKKPLAGGTRAGIVERKGGLPPKGIIKRYICTSAQNNTYVEQRFWDALLVLADHYDA